MYVYAIRMVCSIRCKGVTRLGVDVEVRPLRSVVPDISMPVRRPILRDFAVGVHASTPFTDPTRNRDRTGSSSAVRHSNRRMPSSNCPHESSSLLADGKDVVVPEHVRFVLTRCYTAATNCSSKQVKEVSSFSLVCTLRHNFSLSTLVNGQPKG